jgi:hypothetical protein
MALATTLSRTSPLRGGATLILVTRMSLTPYATAASHSMTSPRLGCALKEIGLVREAVMAPALRRADVDHASAPDGGLQHAQVDKCRCRTGWHARTVNATAEVRESGRASIGRPKVDVRCSQ